MLFSEDTRVKIPCILHLVRLGYQYLSLRDSNWDLDTNIFPDLFRDALSRINPGIDAEEINRVLSDVKLSLDNEDLGKAFYEKSTQRSGPKFHSAIHPPSQQWCVSAVILDAKMAPT